MNRIKLGLLTGSQNPQIDHSKPSLPADSPSQELITPPALSFEYSLFLPAHFESRYHYPLVMWLHDRTGDQQQLTDVMTGISERNYMGIALRGLDCSTTGDCWDQSPTAIEAVSNQIQQSIDLLDSSYRINRNRIFIAGAGCGGTMAFRLAFDMPHLFCGVASFNGGLPDTQRPLLNLRACRQVPVFWVHGRQSCELSEPGLCSQLKLLHVAGFDVTLRQYPCGDQLPRQPFGDFNTWMMEQMAAQPDSGIVL